MKTTDNIHYSTLASAVDSDYSWNADLTLVSQTPQRPKRMRMVAAALGCALSATIPASSYALCPNPNTIECVADIAEAAQYETLYSIEDELSDWEFCKTLRFSKDGMVHEGDVLLDEYLPALDNLMQLSKFIDDKQMNTLPDFAKNLLQEVWESELSDEPLIPGMK